MNSNPEENKLPQLQLPLCGQWIGKFHGASVPPGSANFTFPGTATFNIEYDRPNSGFACIDQGNQIHGSRKDFDFNIEGNQFSGRSTSTIAFDWEKQEVISTEESIARQKTRSGNDIFYIKNIVIENGFIDQKQLNCDWRGSHQGIEMAGKFTGWKLSQDVPSQPDKVMSWDGFKSYVAELIKSGHEFLFRGQSSNKHRLNTSFHRLRRYDLLRYDREACAKLVQHINANSSRQYDKGKPSDFGALLSLAQHHGFPTPLLDWSRSPYVAAFFALEGCSAINSQSENARIYVFDQKAWQRDTSQATHIADPRPSITVLQFPAHNNPRHLPQQSVHTYSNIEDLEAWIKLVETERKQRYLKIINIPSSERHLAMRDLAYMGVTAATLFPGLDGVCRFLKEEFFSAPAF